MQNARQFLQIAALTLKCPSGSSTNKKLPLYERGFRYNGPRESCRSREALLKARVLTAIELAARPASKPAYSMGVREDILFFQFELFAGLPRRELLRLPKILVI